MRCECQPGHCQARRCLGAPSPAMDNVMCMRRQQLPCSRRRRRQCSAVGAGQLRMPCRPPRPLRRLPVGSGRQPMAATEAEQLAPTAAAWLWPSDASAHAAVVAWQLPGPFSNRDLAIELRGTVGPRCCYWHAVRSRHPIAAGCPPGPAFFGCRSRSAGRPPMLTMRFSCQASRAIDQEAQK